MTNIAIFISGRGSNMVALINGLKDYTDKVNIKCVISDQPDSAGLQKARDFNIPKVITVEYKKYGNKRDYEQRILEILKQHSIDLICLAGYMKIVGNVLLDNYPNRILNIHPSLLPAFPGLCAQKKALEYGVKVSGCTVHFVNKGIDTGPIILQRTVEIMPDDTEETLSARILEQEHKIYTEAVKLYLDNKLIIKGRKVYII